MLLKDQAIGFKDFAKKKKTNKQRKQNINEQIDMPHWTLLDCTPVGDSSCCNSSLIQVQTWNSN